MPAIALPRPSRVEISLGRPRGGLPRGDDRLAVVGDDPVPRHLDHADAALRLPRVVADDHRRRARRGHHRHGRLDPLRRLRGTAALGRALRGSAHVRDVPRNGVACAAPRLDAHDRRAACRRTGGAPRAAGAARAERLARVAHPGDDRARPPRSARSAAWSERARDRRRLGGAHPDGAADRPHPPPDAGRTGRVGRS